MVQSYVIYSTRAARPAATMMIGTAVCWVPKPELVDEVLLDEVLSPELVDDSLVLRVELPTVLVKVDEPDVTVVRTGTSETDEELSVADDFSSVEPAVVVKVDEPLVTTDSTEPVVAGVTPDSEEYMVVEPMVSTFVDPSETMLDTTAAVETATDPPVLPVASP